jgi:hypothetical protein
VLLQHHQRQLRLPEPLPAELRNLHLRSIARRHDELTAAGIREVAVFHSAAGQMLPHQGDLPFAVIADPGRELYAAFGVESSARTPSQDGREQRA